MKFAEAYLRLQEIHRLLQSEELIDVEEILELQKEAQQLNEFCQKMLVQ